MKLTQHQIDWVKAEQATLYRIQQSKPRDFQVMVDTKIKYEALNLIVQLHNVQIKHEKELVTAIKKTAMKE